MWTQKAVTERGQGSRAEKQWESQEAHPTSQVLTGPEWGCLRCHTNHTRGSVDTRDKSKSHRSSCTAALSAHCREISAGVSAQATPLAGDPLSPPSTGGYLSSQPRQPPCGYRAR